MSEILSLAPQNVWKHFHSLTQIPRPSGHLEKIQAFLLEFGKNAGVETFQDEVGNIIYRKPATPGMENRKTVILQAHMDMVPQKNKETEHDFEKDPIQTYIDGEWVRAKGTTLGSDNGMGVAAIMAVMEDKTLKHGPLVALITSDEETGMYGAFGLKPGTIEGDILLNLDSEDEGELYIGCAGGEDLTATLEYKEEETDPEDVALKVTLKGLRGGHSGIQIGWGHANANKLMARFLNQVTVAVGQLKVRPGEELSTALKNYAANYYVSGSGNMDLEAALTVLQKRKKEVEKSLKNEAQKRLQKRQDAERAAEYTAKELDRIQREAAAGEEEIRRGKRLLDTYEQIREEKKKRRFPFKQGIIWFVVMILLVAFLPSSIRYYAAGIWGGLGVLAVFWMMRSEEEQLQSEEEQATRRRIEKLKWNREKLRAERRERQVEYENIQEKIAETCTVSEEEMCLEKQREAMELAAARMQEVSGDVRKETGNRLAARAGEILGEITEERYTKIFVEEGLDISIFDGVRKHWNH